MGLLLELLGEIVLPKKYLGIALVVVSKINNCTYCLDLHTPRLISLGLDANISNHILDDEVPGFYEVDVLVREFAVQLTKKAPYIRDAIFEDLRKHFTEPQITELILHIALCGFSISSTIRCRSV